MSTQTFVNALIGLARECKKQERRADAIVNQAKKRGKESNIAHLYRPAFGNDVTNDLIESGYFEKASATVFGDALEALLQNSTPKRKTK